MAAPEAVSNSVGSRADDVVVTCVDEFVEADLPASSALDAAAWAAPVFEAGKVPELPPPLELCRQW